MMHEFKWHMSPTQAGKIGGRWHYDIGADDNENIALVYPAEDGPKATAERAKLICEAPETKRQRDMLLAELKRYHSAAEAAWKELVETHPKLDLVQSGRASLDATAALISACEGDGG